MLTIKRTPRNNSENCRGGRDRLRAEYERAILQQLDLRKAAKAQLGELLAIIHRDGGHYQETHGTEKAVNDAHLIWADLMSKAEEAEAEVVRLKAELAEAHRVIETLDEAMGILVNLTASIRKHGNYGPEATVTFLEQVGQCLWEARSVLAKEPA